MALELRDEPHLLRLVDPLDGFERLEIVAFVVGEFDEGLDVFRKAAPAEANARETRNDGPDAPIGSDRLAHLIDVGAEHLAHVRDLVHERDARRQNGIRRVLAQLRARAVHHHDRAHRCG